MIKEQVAGRDASRPAILILGLGNPLRGDDGIGPVVIEELLSRDLPEGVTALDGGSGGLDLLQMLEGWDHVVAVDAAEVGLEPGQFVRFTPDEAHLAQRPTDFSLHYASLSEVLILANALGRTLPEIVIFGIQPAKIDWGEGLTPSVKNAIPNLIDAILKEVTSTLL